MSAQGLGVVNNESPHCPLYTLAFKVDILNYCVKLRRCGFLLSVWLKVTKTDLASRYISPDHHWEEFKNKGCINQTYPRYSRELSLQSYGQPVFFNLLPLNPLLFHPFTFHMCPSWPAELVNNQQPSVSIRFNQGSACISLFIRVHSSRQPALCVGTGGITTRLMLVCTYMPPLHTDSLRQHCSERWRRCWKGSGGMDEMGGGGGQKSKSGFRQFHLSPCLDCCKLCQTLD